MANYIDNTSLSQILTYLKKYIDDIANTKQNSLHRTIWGASDTGGNISGNMFVGDNTKVNNYLEYANGAINLQGNIFITGGNAATKDYVNNAIGNLQIGGRNLLTNSKGRFQPSGSAIDNWVQYLNSTISMVKGRQYILSGQTNGLFSNIHNTSVVSNRCVLWIVGNGYNVVVSDSNTGTTGTIFTWNYPTGTYNLRVNGYNPDNSTYAEYVKVEEGNKRTTWSPAPEDVDAAAQTYADRVSANGNTAYNQVNWQSITADTDLNNMKTTGKYMMKGTISNAPVTAWAYLVVEYADSGRITQTIWHDTDAAKKYTRLKYNETWGSWSKIANDSDVSTAQTNAINAAATDATNKVNGIQVGGRNLITNSDNGFLNGIHTYPRAQYPILDDGWNRFNLSSQLQGDEVLCSNMVTITQNGWITESVYVKTDGELSSCNISFYDNSTGHHSVKAKIEYFGGNTYRVSASYNNPYTYSLRVIDLYPNTNNSTYIAFRYPQLEYGNKVTDFNVAPEDVDAAIASAQSTATSDAAKDAASKYLPLSGGTLTGTLNATTINATTFIGELQGNAATATKLKTPIRLWGQSFDGSGDVNGVLTMSSLGMATNWTDVWNDGTNSHPWYGYDHRFGGTGVFSTTITDYCGMTLRTAQANISLTEGGRIGINTYTPSYALDVNGTFHAGGLVTLGNNLLFSNGNGVYGTRTTGDTCEMISFASDNTVSINKGFYALGDWTKYYGAKHVWFYGTTAVIGMFLDSTGYLGIGTTTPAYTLDVNGNGHFAGPVDVGGVLQLSNSGLKFADNAFGGGGDIAKMYLATKGGEATTMTFEVENDSDDTINFITPSDTGLTHNNNIILDSLNYSNYALSLTGGTMTGVIKSNFASNTWINGVTNACLTGNYTGYGAIFNAPVKDGRISLSTYPYSDNSLYFGFATAAQITAGTNSLNSQIVFDMANSAIAAAKFIGNLQGNADWLSNNSRLQYGASGLQYFYNYNLNTSNSPSANSAPDSDWWHIIRMNHANGGGYYADLAFALNNTQDAPYFRIVVNGSVARGWSKFITSDNIGSQNVNSANYINIVAGNEIRFNRRGSSFDSGNADLYFGYAWSDGASLARINRYIFMNGSNNGWAQIVAGGYQIQGVDNNSVVLAGGGTMARSNGADANTIVTRDVNGYGYFNYVNTNIGNEDGSEPTSFYYSYDNWIRKMSYGRMKNLLNRDLQWSNYLPTGGGTINGALLCNEDLSVNGYTTLNNGFIEGSFGMANGVDFSGGHVSGVGLKVTQYFGGSLSSQPALISKFDNVVLLMTTGWYQLPEMNVNDDGHLVMIKRLVSGSSDSSIRVMTNNGWHNGNTYSRSGLIVDSGWTGTDVTIGSMMDAMTFIYCRDLSMGGYTGVWVQWKNPRDW